jgi:sugar phosphate isomerase/epimerase
MDRSTISIRALSPDLRESLRIARLLNFQGIALDATGSTDLTALSGSGYREVDHLIRSNDLTLVGLRASLDRKGLSRSADLDKQIATIDRAMDASSKLQAPLVCVDLLALPTPPTQGRPKPKITPEQAGLIVIPSLEEIPSEPDAPVKVDTEALSNVTSAMIEIGSRADRRGVRVAFSAGLSSFAALIYAIESARCPWFGVDLNPVDVLRDDWNIDEVLSAVARQLLHVQVKDAALGNDRRTQPALVGHGDVNWRELMERLKEADYRGPLTVDPAEQSDRISAARVARETVMAS